MKLTMQVHQAVRRLAQSPIQYHRTRQFVRKFHGHSTPRVPRGLPSSWPSAILAAGVTSFGLTSWLYAPWASDHSEKQQTKYADRETMLKVSSRCSPKIVAANAKECQGVKAIVDVLGPESITMNEDDIDWHSNSEASTAQCATKPVAVVSPKNTEEVSIIARICSEYKIPMIPFAGGSSVEGHFTAPYSGLSIDFSAMNQIIKFHEEDMDVVVQPGVNWVDLNDKIKDSGLFLPMDPSPTALIGGMVATNCSGTNAVRYGTMKDWVINLTVVLADGSVIKTRHRPRKTSAGYNLTGLFTGSEGTLGMITEITLKLAPIPENESVAVATFPSVKDAVSCVSKVIRRGILVASVELMDEIQMAVLNRNGGSGGRTWQEKPTLLFKFSGSTEAIAADIERVEKLVTKQGGSAFEFARTTTEMHNLWAARKEALWAMLAQKPEGTQIWSTDVAVPLSRLPEIIDLSKREAQGLGLFSSVLGHVGDGNFHQAIMYDPNSAAQVKAVQGCVSNMVHRAVEMEGTVSVGFT
ncbi:hypothetical protein ANOM_004948 [Aspergillus nomiae NRRL 13137]|uniref:FAD-binding PCMH-type domain-containing protein n=1 Tax=Aspergillus nomiae NRRL (strain ATCC 15546 / NRRL 13137 / CBS 260.88 / M93) TaxID=1509407 RepID=A0A0L1J6C0_ASPN3|nr:uncharacterized protein ANOM_004948 [Aspergillus nomiae NRRL 13137]KNG87289.1 hypothetical protein ANOM_004948 [Aspergillus nomiae NRRL 13137]